MSEPFHYEQYPGQESPPVPVQRPAAVPMAYLAAPMTDQQPTSTPVTVIAWVVTVVTGLYMLPWAIAATRGKANQWSVFVVSLLLGWTGVGWLVALVMACTAHRPVMPGALLGYAPMAALPPAPIPAGWYPNPQGQGHRYWDGYRWTNQFS